MPDTRPSILSLLGALLLTTALPAQDNFQQHVDYTIKVELDDQTHTLSGDISMEYTNQSPRSLDSLWIHLWGNAFSQPLTDFGKQMLRQGETRYYFAKDSERGAYSRLDFSANGKKTTWYLLPGQPDLAVVRLDSPLQPGETLRLSTPFTLKVPDSFSRLGHVGTSYQMTQWYPKPAVFDHKGWHPMPYLDQGEFYSEFGNYDVSITLPDNYVVGATGTLQTESEQAFLNEKAAATRALMRQGFPKDAGFPASSADRKTIRYTAENVHDFAWFADKRFHVLRDEAVLPSGRKVATWAMFTNEEADLWTQGAFYVKRAVEFYSSHVGEYPWPQATAVQSALSAGAGMEYPMVTVIGRSGTDKALDNVITHEVGHNWFYGILASNERDHAWMDEGLNSYYEYRYMETYHGQRNSLGVPRFLTQGSDYDAGELVYLFQSRRGQDQAPETPSDKLSKLNYGIGAYFKPGYAFWHLAAYLGLERFDQAMKSYYQEWKFRHPYPSDLRGHLERQTGKDLAWLFEGYLGSVEKLDYALRDARPLPDEKRSVALKVVNRGGFAAPFPVSAYRGDTLVATRWFEGFMGSKTLVLPDCLQCDRYELDAGHATLDAWRKNNHIRSAGLIKTMEPFQLRVGGFLETSRFTTLNIMPVAGWNLYDGISPGLLIHNGLVPGRKLEYQLLPEFGFNSKRLSGTGCIQLNVPMRGAGAIQGISIGLSGRRYGYRTPDALPAASGLASTHLAYSRLVPYIRLEMSRPSNSQFYHFLQWRSVFLWKEETRFLNDIYQGKEWDRQIFHEFSWELGDKRAMHPYSLRLVMEASSQDPADIYELYLKTSLELRTAVTYYVNRRVDIRFFGGKFFQSEQRKRRYSIQPEAFNMTAQGFNDYRYDDLYFGRTETEGLWSRQIQERDGGMKVAFGSPYLQGRSNFYMLAMNVKADFPMKMPAYLPLRAYFDLGYYDQRAIGAGETFSDRIWWQGGLALELGRGVFGVYVPLVSARVLSGRGQEPGLYDFNGQSRFLERIVFTLNLDAVNPWRLRNQFRS